MPTNPVNYYDNLEREYARLDAENRELRGTLSEAMDLVPRISDDDPMAPALAEWCRGVRAALAKAKGAA